MLSLKQKIEMWLPVVSITLAIFSVVTTEMMPIGLLTMITDTLQTPVGEGGMIVALPAIVAAITAPLTLLFGAKINRKWLLIGLMSLLLVSNLLSALSGGMGTLLFSRILLGICLGGIWTIAGGLGFRLVPSEYIALATSVIFSGVAAAYVLGVPLGVFLGDLWHWRRVFLIMAIFVALLILLVILTIPSLPSKIKVEPSSLIQLLSNKNLLLGLTLTLLLVGGQFMAYTYVRPLLLDRVGFTESNISTLLFSYGFIGIFGNFFFGIMVHKRMRVAIAMIIILVLFVLLLFHFVAVDKVIAIIVFNVWGFAYGGISVAFMVWMMRTSPDNTEPATALYISVFNIAIAGGAYFGGVIYDTLGLMNTLLIASGLVFLALVCLVIFSSRRVGADVSI